MTNSSISRSEGVSQFGRLDARIQRWIWKAEWTELRDIQNRAISIILDGGSKDLIIAASTAGGKTESVFFPILTQLAESPGLAICISPLKALINDQWTRLESLTKSLQIMVTPWHGDISQARKNQFFKKPRGCLLITPESLEAMLMRNGPAVAGGFASLRYIVIDELHAFMGTERGKQLQSLLHRIEVTIGHRVSRYGLSATLGDMAGAAEFLRPSHGNDVVIIESSDSKTLQVLVKGVLESERKYSDGEHLAGTARPAIAEHLYKVLRGSSNLVFPNARTWVEYFADFLRRKCEAMAVPNEFWPHHGNLSKEIREETEAALKKTERPATVICTSTLELGIDIGPVRTIVQVGPPPSVASLRQRLGRSGRRKDEPMILRAYCIEDELGPKAGLSDMLREGLVCSIAMIHLLGDKWYEPINTTKLHASTLVQQTLSALVQYGGAKAQSLYQLLCGGEAPFASVTRSQFISLLQKLGEKEILFQDPTGLILLTPKGEKITGHYGFYSAFMSDDEFRIVHDGRTLGSIPLNRPLTSRSHVIFAGRRWEVMNVSEKEKRIEVSPATGGTPPAFNDRGFANIHDRVRKQMRVILRSSESVQFLDVQSRDLLEEARANYIRLELDRNQVLQMGDSVCILTWSGDCLNDTLALSLSKRGLSAANEGIFVLVRHSTLDIVQNHIQSLCNEPAESPVDLAGSILLKEMEKWDHLLPEDLLNYNFASSRLDVSKMLSVLEDLRQSIVGSVMRHNQN